MKELHNNPVVDLLKIRFILTAANSMLIALYFFQYTNLLSLTFE